MYKPTSCDPAASFTCAAPKSLLPNIQRLTDAVRKGKVFLVSDACVHMPNDEEFKRFPPHCVRGTPGAEIVPEALAKTFFTIPNRPGVKIPPRSVEGAAGHSRKTDARCVRQSQRGDYLAAPGLVHRARRGVLRLWRGYGVLRALGGQGVAAAPPPRFACHRCDRNIERRRRRKGRSTNSPRMGAKIITTDQALAALDTSLTEEEKLEKGRRRGRTTRR